MAQNHGVGETVPKTGTYECSACGYQMEYEASDSFSECPVCYTETAEWFLTINE